MAKVQLANVTVLDNPTAFLNPFQFEITFDCLEDLADGERTAEAFAWRWLRPNHPNKCPLSLVLFRPGVADSVRGVGVERGVRPDPRLCSSGASTCRQTQIRISGWQ